MSPLLKAEFRRIRARRLTLVVVILAVAFPLLTAALQFNSLRPLSAEEMAVAQQEYQLALDDWEANAEEYCGSDVECRSVETPQLEWFTGRLTSDGALEAGAENAVMYAMMLTVLLCASLVGAEFATGSMSNQLTFTPNRTKVFLSKWVANLAISAAVSAIVVATMTGGIYATIALAGAETPTSVEPLLMLLRAASYGIIGGLLGTIIGFITRNTAATLGVFLGYTVLSGTVQYGLYLINQPLLVAYLPDYHFRPLLTGRTVDSIVSQNDLVITWAHSSFYWVVFLGLASAFALWLFRRRDAA